MKELVITHNINGIANIAIVDYGRKTVTVKRVPSDSPMLRALLSANKLRECYSELRDDSDVWLLESIRGWVSVSCDGVVSNTRDSKRLEKDAAAFLAAFVETPVWSDKSKVFVAKLIQMGHRVALRPYIKVAGMLSPEVASAFARMSVRVTQVSESVDAVSQIEVWGHTLNVLYGSKMEFLESALLCEKNWLPPLMLGSTVMWRGMPDAQGRFLYVYLKGDSVLYVGYDDLREAELNRYTTPREFRDVLTFENLLSPTCEGLLDVHVDYIMRDAKFRDVRVCNERLTQDIENILVEFLFDSMVLIDVVYAKLPNSDEVQTSWLYDIVNNKIHVFKAYKSERLGTYYGEMTVEEWRERKDNYLS